MLHTALSTQNISNSVKEVNPSGSSSFLQPASHLDVTLVFGEGPIKSLVLPESLTDQQRVEWETFRQDPMSAPEPDFFVLEEDLLMPPLENSIPALSHSLAGLSSQQLLQLQHRSELSLRRMGKQNALAAGMALLMRMTDEIVITGGHTIAAWQKEKFQKDFIEAFPLMSSLSREDQEKQFQQYLNYFIRWPSEAELMADVIKRHFGVLYEQKYGRSLESVMHLETNARNTIENLTLSLNAYPQLLSKENKIGLLSAGHHLERCAIIAHRFNMFESKGARLSAQKILFGEASEEEKEDHICLINDLEKREVSEPIKKLLQNEKRFIKGLKDPSFITYWLGFTFELDDPKRIVDVLHQFHDEKWQKAMADAFQSVGLDFSTFTALDLEKLAKADYQRYHHLLDKLSALIGPEYRQIPTSVN